MSQTANKCVRCDWCGRISRHPLGEYQRDDGSVGYIHSPDWDKGGPKDICDDCMQAIRTRCVELFPSQPMITKPREEQT